MNLNNTETLLGLALIAVISALIASGLTYAALILFFKNLLASPAALKLMEGLVDSFPPQTRELIHVIAQLIETISASTPGTETDPTPPPAKPGAGQ